MNSQIIAVCIQEGGKLLSYLIKNQPIKPKPPAVEEPTISEPLIEERKVSEPKLEEGKATSVEAGCVPCAIGHMGTCSGLLNEGMRFAKKEGIQSSEVIDRINICLDELNAMERVDLRPEMIAELPDWEKELANKALSESRTMRHNLESISSVTDLEKTAARTQTARQDIGRQWFKERLAKMSPEEKEKLNQKVSEKLKEVNL